MVIQMDTEAARAVPVKTKRAQPVTIREPRTTKAGIKEASNVKARSPGTLTYISPTRTERASVEVCVVVSLQHMASAPSRLPLAPSSAPQLLSAERKNVSCHRSKAGHLTLQINIFISTH